MGFSNRDIAPELRSARERKQLSQRALSKLTSVPQSHISKIEAGEVDLRVSSLIELARALDLELILVPKTSVHAVEAVVRSGPQHGSALRSLGSSAQKEIARLNHRHAQTIRLFPSSIELAKLGRQIRELEQLPLTKEDRVTLNEVASMLSAVQRKKNLELIPSAVAQLQSLRNQIVHNRLRAPVAESVRPAYSLDETQND